LCLNMIEEETKLKSLSKILMSAFLSVSLLMPLSHSSVLAQSIVPSGDGSQASPYILTSLDNLDWLNTTVNAAGSDTVGKYYELANDIDATGWATTPIGGSSTTSTVFSGTLDGKGHKISNLTITATDRINVGFIGKADGKAVIKNIGLENASVYGGNNTGILVGALYGVVSNSYVKGKVEGQYFTGGLVGNFSFSAFVRSSYSTATVKGASSVGGLVGGGMLSEINNSFATGNVTGSTAVGGLIGVNDSSSSVKNSYSTGNVVGTSATEVGALVGTSNAKVENSFWNTGSSVLVSGVEQTPQRVIGKNTGTQTGLRGKTSAEMQSPTFIDELNANKGTEPAWVSGENGLPTSNLNGHTVGTPTPTPTPDPGAGGGTPTPGPETGTTGYDVDIVGAVNAATIIVTVPTALSFVIDTNAETVFTSVPAQITNGTKAPITFQVLGLSSETGTSAKVVDHSKYSDAEWGKLGKTATEENIALGIKPASGGSTIWSSAEVAEAAPTQSVGTINLTPLASENISVDAKHGLAWGSAKTLNYKLFVRVALS
jgi:hypothetical protein